MQYIILIHARRAIGAHQIVFFQEMVGKCLKVDN